MFLNDDEFCFIPSPIKEFESIKEVKTNDSNEFSKRHSMSLLSVNEASKKMEIVNYRNNFCDWAIRLGDKASKYLEMLESSDLDMDVDYQRVWKEGLNAEFLHLEQMVKNHPENPTILTRGH